MSTEFFAADPDAVDHELEEVVCACLHQLIATLKSDDAELIERIDLNHEPHEPVAASLGISLHSLGERLNLVRRVLKQRLVEMCLTCPEHGIVDCDCNTARRAELWRAVAAELG